MSADPEAAPPLPGTRQKPTAEPAAREPLRPGDFYIEGAYVVFTEAYHLRRGFCCHSDCRHCPFRQPL